MNSPSAFALSLIVLFSIAPGDAHASGGEVFSFGTSGTSTTCMGASGGTLVPTSIDSTNIAGVRFVQGGGSHGIFAGSGRHSLLLTEDGDVFACGTNANYRTGQSVLVGSTDVATEINYGTSVRFVQIAVGGAYGLLIGDDARAYAFGHGALGQTGLNDTSNVPVPTAILTTNIGSQDILDIAAGEYHSLVLAADGRVFAFGSNQNGQTGLATNAGNTLIPVAIDTTNLGMLDIVKVAAGAHHSLLLDENGVVYSFGSNTNGRTGLNTEMGETTIATAVDTTNIGMREIVEMAAGETHSLLLADDGTVFSFGFNFGGQTGLGTESGSTLVATAIDTTNLTGKTIVRLAAGQYFSLLLADDGTAFGFGDNFGGKNGQGLSFGATTIATPIDTTNLGSELIADIGAGGGYGLAVTELPEPGAGPIAAILTLARLARRSPVSRRPAPQH